MSPDKPTLTHACPHDLSPLLRRQSCSKLSEQYCAHNIATVQYCSFLQIYGKDFRKQLRRPLQHEA
jgi:hypothetical protein